MTEPKELEYDGYGRKQVYLPHRMLALIKHKAKEEGVTSVGLIRQILSSYLNTPANPPTAVRLCEVCGVVIPPEPGRVTVRRRVCSTRCVGALKTYIPNHHFDNGYTIDPTTGCWMWDRAKTSQENFTYGVLQVDRKPVLAHRFSYTRFKGAISEGLFVCHTCDRPSCVNPAHLWLGTNAENTKDRDEKGRGGTSVGERNGASKLTVIEVSRIKEGLRAGRTQQDLANTFGVSVGAVGKIKRVETWVGVE